MTTPRIALLFAVWTESVGRLGHALAGDHRPDTDWLRDARVGVFMHLLPSDAPGLERAKGFDVDTVTAQLEDAGPNWNPQDGPIGKISAAQMAQLRLIHAAVRKATADLECSRD